MSHFLRQMQVLSSLKPSSDGDKFFPFYKVIAPILSYDPMLRQMHTQVLTKNLQLKTEKQKEVQVDDTKSRKNLAIIVSWLLAKGSHLDKYCKLYTSRGYDVLTVRITPQQMLFPTTGSQIVASSILDYLEDNKQYNNVLMHAFSVGGYLMGEMFVKFHESLGKYKSFTDRVSGVILDSAVDFEGISVGFPRALSKNPLAVRCLEWYIKSHMAVMHNVATKHYLRASKAFHETPLKCPALFLVSKGDKIGTPSQNRRLADDWEARGINVSFKCWGNSHHVSHMHYYKDEYIAEIDNFLSKMQIKS